MRSLFGIDVIESRIPLVRQVPVRKHKKRRNQSEAYHRRVQKKWTKRFGTKAERYALVMDPRFLMLPGGPMVVMNPQDILSIRNIV